MASYQRGTSFSLWDLEALDDGPLQIDLPLNGEMDFAFSKSGNFLRVKQKHDSLCVWQVGRKPQRFCDFRVFVAHRGFLAGGFSPDDRALVVATSYTEFKAYDLMTNPPVRCPLPGLRSRGQSFLFADNKFLIVNSSMLSWSRLLAIWDNYKYGCSHEAMSGYAPPPAIVSEDERFLMHCGRRNRKDKECSTRLFDVKRRIA